MSFHQSYLMDYLIFFILISCIRNESTFYSKQNLSTFNLLCHIWRNLAEVNFVFCFIVRVGAKTGLLFFLFLWNINGLVNCIYNFCKIIQLNLLRLISIYIAALFLKRNLAHGGNRSTSRSWISRQLDRHRT